MTETEAEPALLTLSIQVCENCVARVPGECHVPGCFYIYQSADEVPTHLEAYVLPPVGDLRAETIEAVRRDWPDYAAIHGRRDCTHVPPVRDGGNTAALIELAVDTALTAAGAVRGDDKASSTSPPTGG